MSTGNNYLSPFQEGASVTQVRRFPGMNWYRRRDGVIEDIRPPNGDDEYATVTIKWDGIPYPSTYPLRSAEEAGCFRVRPATA